MEPNFIHLRLHTEYSLSDGLISISGLMEKATAFAMPAMGISDQGNLFAAVKFYQAAMQAGIKPLIGCDVWIAHETKPKESSRLTLFCQTQEGYKNLLQLLSKSFLEGQTHGKPTLKKSWLSPALTQGLIALSGAQEGEIGKILLAPDQNPLEECIQFWLDLFPNHFYLEVSRVGKPQEANYIAAAIKIAETFSIPLVATNDVRFLNQDDYEAHEARVCIHEGTILNHPQRSRLYTEQQYLRSQKEMQRLFQDIPEALSNTVEIAKRCNVRLTLGQNRLPNFHVDANKTPESYLSELAHLGLERRLQTHFDMKSPSYQNDCIPYQTRLERELDVINKMGLQAIF